MDVEQFFRSLAFLPTSRQIGDTYEQFVVRFFRNLTNVRSAWLTHEIPVSVLSQLSMPDADVGLDGLIFLDNGIYVPFQAKYRSSGSLTYTELSTTLAEYQRLRFNYPTRIGRLIIITTLKYQPTDDNLNRYSNILYWILRDHQLSPYGSAALVGSGPVPRPQLRNYQQNDLQRLIDNFDPGSPQRALFHAVMGYGKSLVISAWIEYLLQRFPQWVIVVVVPILKLSEQLGTTFDRYFSPVRSVHLFHSENTTEYVPAHVNVILTTNKSYPKLLLQISPQAVIVDEVHRFHHWNLFSGHLLGFTATPTDETLQHLVPVVQRKLGWAIQNDWLVDYQITGFVWMAPVDDLQTTQTRLYTDMIVHIFQKGYSSRMLVICPLKKVSQDLAKGLRDAGLNAYSITSETRNRKRIEDEVMLNGGIITSVNIYKEGVDLVRLDSVMILLASTSEVTIGQILGRPLRPYPGKDVARIYFPILAGEHYTDLESPRCQVLLDTIHYISCHDPDVYTSGSSGGRGTLKKVQILIEGPSYRRSDAELDSEPETPDNLVDKLSVRFYQKYGGKISTAFNPTYLNCSIAAILVKCRTQDTFQAKDIKSRGPQIQQYLGLTDGKTPDQTISRVLTQDIHDKYRLIERLAVGNYRLINPTRALEMIGSIPSEIEAMF